MTIFKLHFCTFLNDHSLLTNYNISKIPQDNTLDNILSLNCLREKFTLIFEITEYNVLL